LSDTLLGRVAIETNQMDGWQDSYTTGQHNGSTDFTNGRVILAWTPSDKLTVQLNVTGFIDHSEVQAGQTIAITPELLAAAPLVPGLLNYPLAPHKDTAADFNPGDDYRRHNNFFQTNLRGDYVLGDDLTLTSISSYSRFHENQLQDIDGTTLSNLNQLTHGDIESASEELRLSGPLGGDRGHFVIGANFAYDQIRENDLDRNPQSTLTFLFVPFGLPLFTSFRDISNQTEDTYAGFVSGDYNLTDAFKIYGGLRYTRMLDRFNGCTADSGDGVTATDYGGLENILRAAAGLPPNPPIPAGGCVTADATLTPGLVRNKLDEDNVSWRAGASWSPSEDTMLYANVSKGYKAGSFPILGATAASQLLPAKQEGLLAYEAGFKLSLFDRSMQLNGAGFHYDYTDKQILGKVLDPVLGPLLRLVNVPKSQIDGAELQLDWEPVDGLTLSAGGSYIASEILDHFTNFDPNGVLTDFNGEAFPNTPRWQFVADARYQWNIATGWDAFLGAGLSYQSKTNGQLGDLPLLHIDAHALVDLRAGIQSDDGVWSATIWGHNVGDVYYWTAVNRNLDTTVRFAGMPATYGVTVGYRFN
jgi:outer membrane receptor protein involved in Fe transport